MPFAPLQESRSEIKILSSRFVAVILPLAKADDFPLALEEVRHRFPKADHYPYAFLTDKREKSSDDGEPSGSAGRPLLALLKKKDLTKTAIIIARYFGGRKLGASRLSRTFLAAAEGALTRARLAEILSLHSFRLHLDYRDYEEVKSLAAKNGYLLSDVVFRELVNLTIAGDDTIISTLSSLRLKGESIEDFGYIETVKERQS